MARVSGATDSKGKGKGNQYQETYRLEVGSSVVAVALEQERGIKTQYGERDALRVTVRGADPAKLFTLWWPRKLAIPPMMTPFRLDNPAKGEYRLIVAETQEEMTRLWQDGDLPGTQAPAGPGASGIHPSVQGILARFGAPSK